MASASNELLLRIKEKSIKDLSNRIEQYLNKFSAASKTLDSEKKAKFITRVLNASYYLLVDSTSIHADDVSELMNVITCCCKHGMCSPQQNLHLLKHLFCILDQFIKLEYYDEASSVSGILLLVAENVEDGVLHEPGVVKDFSNILKNTYLKFWNLAAEQQSSMYVKYFFHSLQFVGMAIQLGFNVQANMYKLLPNALRSVSMYDHHIRAGKSTDEDELDLSVLTSMNELLVKCLKIFKWETEDDYYRIMIDYHKWNMKLSGILDRRKQHFGRDVYFQVLELLRFHSEKLSNAEVLDCIVNLLKMTLKLFRGHNYQINLGLLPVEIEKLKRLWNKDNLSKFKNFAAFVLLIMKSIQKILFAADSRKSFELDLNTLLKLEPFIQFRFELLSDVCERITIVRDDDEYVSDFTCALYTVSSAYLSVSKDASAESLKLVYPHLEKLMEHSRKILQCIGNSSSLDTHLYYIGKTATNFGTFRCVYHNHSRLGKAGCLIETSYKLQEFCSPYVNHKYDIEIWNKYVVHVNYLRKMNKFDEALNVLERYNVVHGKFPPDYVSVWTKVEKAASDASSFLKSRLLPKPSNPDDHFNLLLLKLKESRKHNLYDGAVYIQLHSAATTNIQMAIVLVNMSLYRPMNDVSTCVSAKTHSLEALELLRKEMHEKDNSKNYYLKELFAQAHLALYLAEFKISFLSIKDKRSNDGGGDQSNNKVGLESPTILNDKLAMFVSLNAALTLWNELLNEEDYKSTDVPFVLQQLITIAENFSLEKDLPKEIEAWKLALKLSSDSGHHITTVYCSSRLCQLYCEIDDSTMAWNVLQKCKNLAEELKTANTFVSNFVYLKYKFALARVLLFRNQINEGILELNYTWLNIKIERLASYELYSELHYLTAIYIQTLALPGVNFDSALGWSQMSAFEHISNAANMLLRLMKKILADGYQHDVADVEISGVQKIYLLPRALSQLFNTTVMLVEMGKSLNFIHNALGYLKETSRWVSGMCLPFRSLHFLLLYADLDLLCENFKECDSKLSKLENAVTPLDKMEKTVAKANEKNIPSCLLFLLHQSECTCDHCSYYCMSHMRIAFCLVKAKHSLATGKLTVAFSILQFLSTCFNSMQSKCKSGISTLSQQNCCVLFKHHYYAQTLLCLSQVLFADEKYGSSLNVAKEAEQLVSCMCLEWKLDVIDAEILWLKSLCFLRLAAKKSRVTVRDIITKIWKSESCFSEDLSTLVAEVGRLKLSKHSETDNIATSPHRRKNSCTVNLKKTHQSNDGWMSSVAKTACKAPVKKRTKVGLTSKYSTVEPTDNAVETKHDLFSELSMIPLKEKQLKTMRTISISSSDDETEVQEIRVRRKNLAGDQMKKPERSVQPKSLDETKEKTPRKWKRSKPVVESPEENLSSASRAFSIFDESSSSLRNEVASSSRKSRRKAKDAISQPVEHGRITRSRNRLNSQNTCPEQARSAADDENDDVFQAPSLPVFVPPIERFRPAMDTDQSFSNLAGDGVFSCNPISPDLFESSDVEFFTMNETLNEHMNILDENAQCSDSELEINFIFEQLERCHELTLRLPKYPLYSNLCKMLTLLKGPKDSQSPFYLANSEFVVLRHEAILHFGRRIWNNIDIAQQLCKLDVSKTLLDGNSKCGSIKRIYSSLQFYQPNYKNKVDLIECQLNDLPSDWTVCQISLIPNEITQCQQSENAQLVVGRYKNGQKPIIVIPLPSQSSQAGVKTLLSEYCAIMEASHESMKITVKEVWWKERNILDKRLKLLIKDLENIWLGCWKFLFLGDVLDKERSDLLSAATADLLSLYQIPEEGYSFIRALIDGVDLLTQEQLEDVISYLNHLYGITHLPKLCDAIRQKGKMLPKQKQQQRSPIFLVLSKEIADLPWDHMPIFKSQSVLRSYSLSMLHCCFLNQQLRQTSSFKTGVDVQKSYYVINPAGDLTNSESRLKDLALRKNWDGVIGKMPTDKEFTSGLVDNDLYLYCGHGNGSQYFSGEKIQQLKCKAVSLLMGCSSGKLKFKGRIVEPTSIVTKYMLSGCPCVVATLWPVTDNDIDRYTRYLIEKWADESDAGLATAAKEARVCCRCPSLIGASIFVHGLPVRTSAKC